MNTKSGNFENFFKSIENTFNEIKSSDFIQKGPGYQDYSFFLKKITRDRIIKKINFINRLIKPIKNDNLKYILEVGSGNGLNLLILKFLGFKKVVGIEIVKSMNDNANYLIQTAKKYCDFDLENCESILGNAESTNFNDDEFDLIFSIEVISHIPSFDRFLREMNRILKTRSYLVVADSNNCKCPWYYRKRKLLWKKNREKELKERIRFISENYPEINPNLRASIVLHTELMSKNDLCNIIPTIISTNKLPMSLYFEGFAPVYFETGIWNEFGFFPKRLIQDFEKYGFKSWVDIVFGSSRGSYIGKIETLLNLFPLFIKDKLRSGFICYSQKEKRTDYLYN